METNKVTIAELHHHYRRELGLSRRNADYLTRRVYKDAALAHATLPDRWAETLHPGPANLRPIERMTEAGNVGPDARPLMDGNSTPPTRPSPGAVSAERPSSTPARR